MKISAVIPTCNRTSSLRNALGSLLAQTRSLDEIIVIDSSDSKNIIRQLEKEYDSFPVVWIDTMPSVCLQRNTGIHTASGDWIFLCDDDIVLDNDYIEKLETFAKDNPSCGAVAGRLMQFETNGWVDQYPLRDFKELLWKFIFQLSIWGHLDLVRPTLFTRRFYFFIKRFYERRGNGFTLAGWPLITNWEGEVFQTSIYSLGANLIKKEWLLESPYDEVLDPGGIGDNYGVALGFPGKKSIYVLASAFAFHYRSKENRMDAPRVYYRRILALHYFIKRHKKFPMLTTTFFLWSLLGNTILLLFKRNYKMVNKTLKAIRLILQGQNPYWLGFIKNQKIVHPS